MVAFDLPPYENLRPRSQTSTFGRCHWPAHKADAIGGHDFGHTASRGKTKANLRPRACSNVSRLRRWPAHETTAYGVGACHPRPKAPQTARPQPRVPSPIWVFCWSTAETASPFAPGRAIRVPAISGQGGPSAASAAGPRHRTTPGCRLRARTWSGPGWCSCWGKGPRAGRHTHRVIRRSASG